MEEAMTAWEIKFYILACSHFEQPDLPAILGTARNDPEARVSLGFDKPERCRARFEDRKLSRAQLRRKAAKRGWVHVRRKGQPYSMDPDYCPKHAEEGRAEQEKERLEEERFYASLG